MEERKESIFRRGSCCEDTSSFPVWLDNSVLRKRVASRRKIVNFNQGDGELRIRQPVRPCVCFCKSVEGILGRERGARLSESDAPAAAALTLSQLRAQSRVHKEQEKKKKSHSGREIVLKHRHKHVQNGTATRTHTPATNKTHTLVLLNSWNLSALNLEHA